MSTSNICKLINFLKKTAVGYFPKKSQVFTGEEVKAGDNEFLVVKIVLIFGVYGATRADELTKLTLSAQGKIFVIGTRETKTHITQATIVSSAATNSISSAVGVASKSRKVQPNTASRSSNASTAKTVNSYGLTATSSSSNAVGVASNDPVADVELDVDEVVLSDSQVITVDEQSRAYHFYDMDLVANDLALAASQIVQLKEAKEKFRN